MREIEAIRVAAQATASLIPAQTTELSHKLGQLYDVYQNAGPSRPAPGPAYERVGSSYDAINEGNARRALQARARGSNQDDELLGSSTDLGKSWRDRVNLSSTAGPLSWLHLPGAQMTPVDYLNMLSISGANLAQKRQTKLDAARDQRAQDIWQKAIDTGDVTVDRNGNPTSDVPLSVFGNLDQIPSGDTKLGSVSNLFAKAKEGYIQGRTITSMLSDVFRPVHHMTNLGFQTGYDGGGAGPLGFRMPWNAATLGGVSQEWQKLKTAFDQGVSPSQAQSIFGNLYQTGWLQGPQANMMRTGAAQIVNSNPALDPAQFVPMMDKAVRQGAMSISDFVDVMKQVPDAAKASHLSFTQVMADMDQLGQLNKQMGGTYGSGVQNAVAWNSITGLPANIMGQLMQHPLVQGQTFMRTGLIPWEQGLASPYQHMQGIMGAVGMLNNMVMSPHAITQTDSIGLQSKITGQDQKEALMSHLLGVSKEVVHTMLTNRAGYQAGLTIGQSAQDYSANVRSLIGQGDYTDAMRVFGGKPWQTMKKQLGSAVDAQGHKIFEDWDYFRKVKSDPMHPRSDAEAHKLAQQHALQQIEDAGHIGPTKGHWQLIATRNGMQHKWVAGVKGQSVADAAAARAKLIAKYQQENTQKFGSNSNSNTGPKLTIELGSAAKKMFHLSDPNNQAKAARNGGSADIPFSTPSYSSAPLPDPLTSGSGSGSVYDPYGQQWP